MAMASASGSNPTRDNNNTISSSFLRTVCLHDWWLIEAEKDFNGKRLAVGGLTSREQQAVRVFSSAPIIRRYDITNLKTADGITVMIKGFINRSRTQQNGFPLEVWNYFQLGFPSFWEYFAEKCFREESTNGGVSRSISGFDESTMPSASDASHALPVCLDGLPVTRTRDLSLSRPSDSKNDMLTNSIFSHMLGKCSDNASKCPTLPQCSDTKSSSPPVMVSLLEENLSKFEKAKSKQKHEKSEGILGATNMGSKRELKFGTGNDDASDDLLLPTGSDVNIVNPSESNMEVPVENSSNYLTGASERVEGSKSNRIGNKKGNGGLKSEGSENRGSCGYDTIKDEASNDFLVPVGSDMNNISPSKVNTAVPVEISNMRLTILSKSFENLKKIPKKNEKIKDSSMNEGTNFSCISVSQNYEAVMVRCVEDKLSGGNSSGLAIVGLEGRAEESLSTAPNIEHRKISERTGNCSHDTTEYPTMHSGSETNIVSQSKVDVDTVNVTPSKCAAARSSNRLKNLKGNQKENPASKCSVKNDNNELSSMTEAFENPDVEKLTRSSSNTTIPLGGKKNSFEEITSQSEARISKCSRKNLKSNQKEDQTTKSGLGTERNEVNSVSVGSGFVKKIVTNVDHEPGGALDLPDVKLQDIMSELLVKESDNQCPKIGSQKNRRFSSLPTNARRELNRGNFIIQGGGESNDQNESLRSSIRLGDANHANDLKIAVGEEERNCKKIGISRKGTKRKLQSPTHVSPLIWDRRKKASIVSPESLSFKRSRSGRLLVPTLDFWRNQLAVYDADGGITGIQEGLPVVESSRGLSPSKLPTNRNPIGSRSVPQKKKKKLI